MALHKQWLLIFALQLTLLAEDPGRILRLPPVATVGAPPIRWQTPPQQQKKCKKQCLGWVGLGIGLMAAGLYTVATEERQDPAKWSPGPILGDGKGRKGAGYAVIGLGAGFLVFGVFSRE